ncbi:hypothetical protein HN011_007507 [Eciton burchellii]|nr:hypothetical protein HN011_007507 [Eciton burchellii]
MPSRRSRGQAALESLNRELLFEFKSHESPEAEQVNKLHSDNRFRLERSARESPFRRTLRRPRSRISVTVVSLWKPNSGNSNPAMPSEILA